jgi:hypothetical protein
MHVALCFWCVNGGRFGAASKYPVPGGTAGIIVSAKPTEELLLAGDTMAMLVNFIAVQTTNGDEDSYQYRVLKVRAVARWCVLVRCWALN